MQMCGIRQRWQISSGSFVVRVVKVMKEETNRDGSTGQSAVAEPSSF